MRNLIDQVDDGFNYFGYRLEELKRDDVYYIEAFMKYIEVLESKLKKQMTKEKSNNDFVWTDELVAEFSNCLYTFGTSMEDRLKQFKLKKQLNK